MAKVAPLTPTEDDFWRALMQIVLLWPRRLNSDLVQAVGINANEYVTLLSLSEASSHELRMADLARATALSASRTTRLVDGLQARGLAMKRGSAEDGRGTVTSLTSAGFEKLVAACEVHLASVRGVLFDHVDGATTSEAAHALSEVALRLQGTDRPPLRSVLPRAPWVGNAVL